MEFRKVKLKDIVTVLGDGIHGTPKYSENGEYYFINGNNLCNGKIIIKQDTKRVDCEEYKKYKKDLNNRTLLVSINGTLGNIAVYNNEKCILGKSACYFNIKEDVNRQFIKYILYSNKFQKYIQEYATGTTIKNMSLKAMREYEFKLPELDIQNKIVHILLNIDKKIELNNQINDNLFEISKRLYKRWFIDYEFPNENGKPYKSSSGKMIDSEIGEIPDNWRVKQLEELELDISDGNYSSKYPTKQEFLNNGIPFIRGTDFSGKTISRKGLMYISPKKHSELKKGHLKENDILITTRGEIGQIVYVPRYFIDSNINAQLVRINGGKQYPKSYIGNTLLSNKVQCDIKSLITGSALQQLPVGKLKQIKFAVPIDLKIIFDFDNIVGVLLEKEEELENENYYLEQLRDTLLPKLMNGEIDLENIEI